MDALFIPLMLIVVMVGLAGVLKLRSATQRGSTPIAFPYQAAVLLSPAERSFLGALEQSVEGRARIFAKVRLADVVNVRGGLSRSQRTSAFNRISRKHVDFVVCSLGDASVKAVVELDDRSHAAKDRKERDTFVDRALEAAGIECFHVPAASGYSVHQLRRMLEPVLVDPAAPIAHTAATISESTPTIAEQTVAVPAAASTTEDSAPEPVRPACPKCGSTLVERKAKRGARKGERFMACSAFPACRYTQAV